MKLTRRKLAGAILGSAAIALPQTQPPPLPGTPDEELRAARQRIKGFGDTLAKLTVPIEVEPPLQFKA